jgi:hypothetical protein
VSDTLYCGFCAKSQHEVKKLIAGPTVHICNECVDLCHEIVHPPATKAPAKPSTPYAPGSYGRHEALHLASVFYDIVAQHLAAHPAIKRDGEWAKLAEAASSSLFELYQAIGREHLPPRMKEPPEFEGVIGFGEAVANREPGWAEAVATPDEDVGYVFTPLPADFTGLAVDVSVGDDTPLVVATPERLGPDIIAAVRHWVVRHQAALTAHWRDQIGSMELFERLRRD